MNPRRHAGVPDRLAGADPARSPARYFLLSAALHLVLIALLVWVPTSFSTPRLPPGAISVNLVAMPGPAPAGGGGGGEAPKPVETPRTPVEKPAVAAVEPAPKPVPAAPKPEVSIAPPKVREKKSLKEETKNPQKMIEKAVDRIQKSAKEPDTASVTAAIDRIRKKLGEGDSAAPPRPGPPGPGGAEPGPGGGGGGGGGGPGPIEPVDIYRAEVAFQVEKNWAYSPQLAGSNKQLEVRLVFKVLPSGEITDVRYTERSNNTYLDESAYRAIVKSSPVRPHPPNLRMPYVLVGIRFTPEGMR
ncbi:MAG: TonB C-terminal domain-containing protein [Desulfobacteraceae bacterium]|nr:MAG: TonB C-terminal domain-containing protein [Desulfobacteraceae bacterium]